MVNGAASTIALQREYFISFNVINIKLNEHFNQ